MKYRANRLRAALDASRPSKKRLQQFDETLHKADEIRNQIVAANTRLIVSIVNRFADEKNLFDDLLSDGLNSLIKAVEKFDYDRGFRFSTYATMVVRRELYRSMQRIQRSRARFVTGQAEVLDSQEREVDVAQPSESQLGDVDQHVAAIMEKLDEREKLIVSARYGFIDLGIKATFANIGKQLGISKERVRQLEIRALEKLRNATGELGLFNTLRSVALR